MITAPRNRFFSSFRALAITSIFCAAHISLAAQAPARDGAKASLAQVNALDARVNATNAFRHEVSVRQSALNAAIGGARTRLKASTAALDVLRTRAPATQARYSVLTGGISSLSDGAGWLTAAAPQASSESIVRSYVSLNRELFGLSDQDVNDMVALGDSPGGRSGLRMLRMEQRVQGISVFQSESRFLLAKDGRLAKYVGQIVPAAGTSAPKLADAAWMTPAQALADLLAFEGKPADANDFQTLVGPDGRIHLTAARGGYVKGAVAAQRVWFPLTPGLLVPAWQLIVFTGGAADWNGVVDAQTGDLLWRKNMRAHASTQDARFSVYVQGDGTTPADNPAPKSPTTAAVGAGTQYPSVARTNVGMHAAMDATASPNGWIDDGGSTTLGNNVTACLDTDADNTCDTGLIDNNGKPVGNLDSSGNNRDFLGSTPRDFGYQPPPLAGNPDAGDGPGADPFSRGIVTNLFYVANWYHDQLYDLGFDEASGNFQQINFSGMGSAGDPVLADADDGSGTDNSNFSTPPDGTSGRMQMYIFDFPTPERDGSLDGDVMLHELTHGLSNRLIGDGNGLIWDVGGGMGEGWSDFYALSLLNNTNADNPNGKYAFGAYVTYQLGGLTDNYVYGIRRFPYSTDMSVNPLTWADVDDVTVDLSGGITPSPLGQAFNGALEVHNVGEIWALSLWEVRARVIADPAGASGDVPSGNRTMLQLTTDALKMTPINPSFLDARDALIDADCATNGCANEDSIWGGFAKRGLGYGAVAPSGQVGVIGSGAQVGIGESFAVPNLDIASIAIDDSAGNNNGAIDPGEPVRITVTLNNPWRNAGKNVASATATLSSSTSGVTVFDNASSYGAIAAQGSAAGDSFAFTVPTAATCGQALKFTLGVSSALGSISRDFTLRVGTDAGNGTPVTYTRSVSGGLAIPDNDLPGVTDALTISDDLAINALDFRIDNLTHTFTGDLTVALKGPNGYGNDMAYLRGIFIGDSDGDNFINTQFDDFSANDLNLSGAADAPFTSTWIPAFNSPIWSLFGIPNLGPDPVGELSRFKGLSTQGTWRVHATDEAAADTGSLNQWSLIVTPQAFSCAAFSPSVAIAATKTVAGTFRVGQTVTYTVTLTNSGTANQADNPGHEFTDVVPASLTLVDAVATSGAAVATVGTNTVTWDGSLAPLGGSVTITISATINAGAQGTTISNQGTVSYDADGNGTNEAVLLTDDPGVAGATNPTSFKVEITNIGATKTVSAGPYAVGGSVTYTVNLTNSGTAAQADNPGHELVDVLPPSLTLVNASSSSGTTSTSGNSVNWDGALAPLGGSVTITINATINASAAGSFVSNQALVYFDQDVNGVNETTALTDDPGVSGTANPTQFFVPPISAAMVGASMAVSGKFNIFSTATYVVALYNTGNIATGDNAGDEFVDTLPAGLQLDTVSASSGAITVTGGNTVHWNGSIPAKNVVTLTIQAQVLPNTELMTISNQGTIHYDSDGNGGNDASNLTDDPGLPGTSDPTRFTVIDLIFADGFETSP